LLLNSETAVVIICVKMPKTGYVFEELYMWHSPGDMPGNKWLEPTEHWENAATKRRLHNLVTISGLIHNLHPIRARLATEEELCYFHTIEYVKYVQELSAGNGGNAGGIGGGDNAPFGHGGYEIAALSAGGVLAAVDAVLKKEVDNAYCLVRPPGHHAEANKGMGFCIFNNIGIAAHYARKSSSMISNNNSKQIQRIAIVDYDVHHGNGTQQGFWDDPNCLFISLHQANNYPLDIGHIHEIGGKDAQGSNINIPLPPGSGIGCYQYAFDQVVIPAIDRFQPDLILVSSGFDASYADNLGAMMLSSEAYRTFTEQLCGAANRHCEGRIIFAHEGGYSKDYVPFCGIAVIESLSDIRTEVEDGNLQEVSSWGYQELQPIQKAIIDQIVMVHQLPISATISSEVLSLLPLLNDQEQQVCLQIETLFKSISDPVKKQQILELITKSSNSL
jgi:acetoin utilization deacetylase AcuC-like enzyme